MSKTKLRLEAQVRPERGKIAAKALRREGFVPGVIYGHGEEPRPCKVSAKELERLITTTAYDSTIIDLKLDDGDTPTVLIREIQVHPFRSQVLHVDFLAVHKGEKVRLSIPIEVSGVAAGVKEGGILEHIRHEVEIRTIPANIPEQLTIDISALEIGDQLTVGDLQLPEDVELLTDRTAALVQVVPPVVHKLEEEVPEEEVAAEEEAEEPELVGRQKPVEEEAAEEEG